MRSSTLLIVAGILALVAGIGALAFPLPASLAVTVLTGWAFIVTGALGLWAAFSDQTLASRGWVGAIAALNVVVGVWMLAQPLSAMLSLTVVVGLLLIISGVSRIIAAFGAWKATRMQWPLAISGIISAALGLYIVGALPATGLVALGILVAVELIVIGVTLVTIGSGLRQAPPR